MMRKALFLLTALISGFATSSYAQTYWKLNQNHTSGTQSYPTWTTNQSITVTPSTGALSTTPICQGGPYYVGVNSTNGYTFTFNTRPASHVRMQFTELNDFDTVRISVNGAPYTLTPANLSAFAGALPNCLPGVPLANNGVITPNGRLSSTGSGLGTYCGAQLDIQVPVGISNITVAGINNGSSDPGVVFNMWFADSICGQKLFVTDDNPCAGTDLHLTAGQFPNSIVSWTGPGGFTSTSWTPTRTNTNVGMSGWYVATATRTEGTLTCTFKDSVNVSVRTQPSKPVITLNNSPVCRGQDVTLDAASAIGAGGWYDWTGPTNFPKMNGPVTIPNAQPFDVGFYTVIASTLEGCKSEPTTLEVKLLPNVVADWEYDIKLGCDLDTIVIRNLSQDDDTTFWDFNNGSSKVNAPDVFEYYYVNNNTKRTYNILLVAGNHVCVDSMYKTITLEHPLIAGFEVDDDTICQHTKVTFDNKTTTAVGGQTHDYLWNFGDGSDPLNTYGAEHTYDLFGTWEATLVVTDFLGCKDTAKKLIFVDSTGGIDFLVSDDSVCAGTFVDFEAFYSNVGVVKLEWNYSDGNFALGTNKVRYAFDKPGTYPVKFTSINRICPDATSTKNIVVNPFPLVDLGPDTSICPNGAPVKLTELINAKNPNAIYKWNVVASGEGQVPSVLVRHPGVYSATVEINGCATTDSITVFKDCFIEVPNAFSPNGDGNGDYFLPRQLLSKGVTKFDMTIYNRWGQIMFQTEASNGRGWDGMFNGEPQAVGVYIYMVNATFANGSVEKYQGNVTLLR